jgi:hypothetical protein
VYKWGGGGYAETQQLSAPGTVNTTDDQFGYALAMSANGSMLAVAASNSADETMPNSHVGVVYVFTLGGGSGQFALAHTLVPENRRRGLQFGWGVRLSGDGHTLLAGSAKGGALYRYHLYQGRYELFQTERVGHGDTTPVALAVSLNASVALTVDMETVRPFVLFDGDDSATVLV